MAQILTSAPVLSTSDNHILTKIDPTHNPADVPQLSEEEFRVRYEIGRTLSEIRRHRWRRVALQFPDHMLPHSARVFQLLSRGFSTTPELPQTPAALEADGHQQDVQRLTISGTSDAGSVKFTILADTSYGSCCIDEIAAEHISADAVIHYGRACLSPTARLPVLHIFTSMPIDHDTAIQAFTSAYPDRTSRIIITGDIPYAEHIQPLAMSLTNIGYTNIFAASIIHNPSSAIPNRTSPPEVAEDPAKLSDWHIFHLAEPPTALLLTLSSRVASIRIYNPESPSSTSTSPPSANLANTSIILRRRYALVTSMNTVSTWGILINTLSVKNYLHVLEHVKCQIALAGKKSYLFVVGKINAAKVANFSEIGGWVVIGCWESSLIDSKDFYRPILTPFELELALASDDRRVWTGAWRSDFQEFLDRDDPEDADSPLRINGQVTDDDEESTDRNGELELNMDSDEESAPPEFDLRTGRYVSHPRPMRHHTPSQQQATGSNGISSKALTKRATGEITAVNGVTSPAAAYLREKRTWKGLGSDFEIRYDEDEEEDGEAVEGGLIEEGRTGVAGGYTVGDSVRS